MTDNKKIMVLTSTFPKNDKDEVPSFVKDQIVNLSKEYKFLDFTVVAPETNFGTFLSMKEKMLMYHMLTQLGDVHTNVLIVHHHFIGIEKQLD